jgi:hypothetical protein
MCADDFLLICIDFLLICIDFLLICIYTYICILQILNECNANVTCKGAKISNLMHYPLKFHSKHRI